jgi:RNA polymerase sigma-70 factor (ECF subfamily)
VADSFARCSDEDLLLRLRDGQRDVFGTLVRRYERELYGYLKRYLGKADLAEDVFQNTFVAVFRKIRQYEPGRAARPWLYTIATHQAIDAMRRRGRRPDHTPQDPGPATGPDDDDRSPLDRTEGNDPDPAEHAADRERAGHVREAVDQLPEPFKQVVLLAYFQGMRYQDVAQVLDIPVGTVKSRLNAALSKLTEIWGERFPTAEDVPVETGGE